MRFRPRARLMSPLLVLMLAVALMLPAAAAADACPEPNNSFANACAIGTDAPAVGTLENATDADAFWFDAPSDGAAMHAALTGLSGDANVYFFAPDGTLIFFSVGEGNVNEHILLVVPAGRYYLIVTNAQNNAVDYTMTLALEPAPGSGPAAQTDICPEPNDSTDTACYFGTATPAIGALSTPTDADIYVFDVPGGGAVVRATLSDLPADYDLFLTDGISIITASARGGNSDDRLEAVLEGGQYYLEVRNASGVGNATDTYVLTLAIEPPPIQPDICPEPNDSMETACFFGTGFPAVGTLATANDLDAYVFDVPDGGGLVRATLSTLPADYDLFLVSGDGETLIAQSARVGTEDDTLEAELDEGRYFLVVVNSAGVGNTRETYTLTLTIDPPGSAPAVGALPQ